MACRITGKGVGMGWTFYNSNGQRLSTATTLIDNLDIDGATDIGAAIVDADLFIIDDGAGGTNRKTAASRIKTYVEVPSQANQTAIEGQTNEDTYIPPDLLKHNPGVAKFRVVVAADGSITPSYANSLNIASVDDDGVGARGVNLTTAFANTTYSAFGGGDGLHFSATSINASDILCQCYNSSHAVNDVVSSACGFGDQ
jgi:hypothetical protein